MARNVQFNLVADATRFTRGMRQAQRDSQRFTDHTNRAGKAVRTAFAAFSAAAVVVEMRKWVDAARDANRVAARTDAVIRSTRGAAGLSAKGFSDLAKQVMKYAAVDDDVIQDGENILATFNKIKAGGPDRIFEKATKAAVDLAAGMNHGTVSAEGLQSANLVLGKALQDPIKGLSRLTRIGVSFSEQEKQQIADLVKHGQTAKAQGVILAAVNAQFGGSAAAAVTPAKRLAVTWGNMQEVLGNLLIPTIDRGARIMTGFLEVADRNRTAFGVLLGVLATGAAVIATLVVATKVHKAVTEGVTVVTETWKTAQKGLNTILGVTRAQAAATAATQGELAAATTGAGTAAAGASVSFSALAGRLVLFGGATTGTVAIVGGLSDAQKRHTAIIDTHGSALDRVKDKQTVFAGLLGLFKDKTDKAKTATQQQTAATQAQVPELQKAAAATAENAKKTTELAGKLKELKQGFADQVKSTKDAILAYDGLIAKSGVTAQQVIRDLHNQVANFRTYSKDVQRLIKAGVSPAAIQELSQKGPQYVHALATGSARELAAYKKAWHDRQAEVKGSFAASMQAQYADLVRKMRAMQREINKLKGKSVSVTATAEVNLAKTTIAYLRAFHVKAPQFATGGPVSGPGTGTSDSVPAWLSQGEYVVNARAAAKHRQELEWINADRYATGGAVGPKLDRVLRADAQATRIMGQSLIGRVASTLGRAIAKAIDKAASAGGGAPGIKAFILSTDRLPYRWGAAGPGAYDCSGLVGAVYGKMRGDPHAGRGRRYFTTGSISTAVPGLRSGLGGVLNIGVTAGSGHMAGSYGGLGFEARSTRTGIFTGRAARSPSSFARHYHMASGGLVGLAGQLSRVRGLDVAGDPSRMTVVGGRFTGLAGGGIVTRPTLAVLGERGPEAVVPLGRGGLSRADADLLADAFLRALERRPPVVRVDEVHRGLLAHKRGRGNIALGLG